MYLLMCFWLTDVLDDWASDNQNPTVVSFQPFGKYFYKQIMVTVYIKCDLKQCTK